MFLGYPVSVVALGLRLPTLSGGGTFVLAGGVSRGEVVEGGFNPFNFKHV